MSEVCIWFRYIYPDAAHTLLSLLLPGAVSVMASQAQYLPSGAVDGVAGFNAAGEGAGCFLSANLAAQHDVALGIVVEAEVGICVSSAAAHLD